MSTQLQIRQIAPSEVTREIYDLLLKAEPLPQALDWSHKYMTELVYLMELDGELVGASDVSWKNNQGEVIELAIKDEHQGKGYGKLFMAWLVEEARRRKCEAVTVGTANASIQNLGFYQKCGFRMHEIRHDYFHYYQNKRYENGILVRDLVVFRYDLPKE
jgi:ribosomal protein S18 acetylase RimI-like enzyme